MQHTSFRNIDSEYFINQDFLNRQPLKSFFDTIEVFLFPRLLAAMINLLF